MSGFVANLTFNDQKAAYIAKVINCEDTILCGGRSPKDIRKSLIDNIDLYLELCKRNGIMPHRKPKANY